MILSLLLLHLLSSAQTSWAFSLLSTPQTQSIHKSSPSLSTLQQLSSSTSSLNMVAIGKNYKPKWKKQKTLIEESGGSAPPAEVGLVGTVPVQFRMGNETRTTMASVGQPIRDVASQAGQYIKYGCGKGECGVCESKCNGQWIRPCQALIPADYDVAGTGEPLVIEVKAVKNKAKSSGKFYSVRSFLFGFYNNVLGMFAFVKTRRAAKKNYNERIEYEDMIKQKVLEKKLARQKEELEKENNK